MSRIKLTSMGTTDGVHDPDKELPLYVPVGSLGYYRKADSDRDHCNTILYISGYRITVKEDVETVDRLYRAACGEDVEAIDPYLADKQAIKDKLASYDKMYKTRNLQAIRFNLGDVVEVLSSNGFGYSMDLGDRKVTVGHIYEVYDEYGWWKFKDDRGTQTDIGCLPLQREYFWYNVYRKKINDKSE